MYGMTPDCDGVYRNWHVTPWGTHRLTEWCADDAGRKCRAVDAGMVDNGRVGFWRWVAVYALKQMRKEERHV